VELNGKAPLGDASAAWTQEPTSERQRTTERHRRRRRTRVRSAIRERIRVRVWLACTGALLAMALGLYLVLGHQGG
jgi:hypothetical protein